MTIQHEPNHTFERRIPVRHSPKTGAAAPAAPATTLAILRIATGFLFLWAFFDKLFGLGYSTPAANAWIGGGSPTRGFLGHVDVGPFESTFRALAGSTWADWLFMLGLAGIGIAVLAGVGLLRISAVAGTIMMLLMWAAEWPLAQFTSAGEPSGSTNPLVDYHVVYALVLIVLAVTYAGNTWGFGRLWAKLPTVDRNRWLT